MRTRQLGRLGHLSSVLIYGGAALSEATQDEADRSIELALAAGINHFDTAAGYGESELRLGAWMPRVRDRIFLATKTGDRTAGGAYDSIRRSLERLDVQAVDLVQLHAIGNIQDLDLALGAGGAVEGVVRAREEGLTGAIGITGHGMQAPAVHLEALRRFDFDTVLTPYNFALSRDASYRRDFDALAQETSARGVGLMAIKAIARNNWRHGEAHRYTTWYEPLDERDAIDAVVDVVLRRPEITGICTAGEMRLLPMMIDAERKAGSGPAEQAERRLAAIPDLGSPFVRTSGRDVPDWLSI
jgi:aryl-alcohol dehydrogenase-like predicted oxidoreductase